MGLLNKILIANRGEIALRIIRSANKLAIKTVAIYTEPETDSDFVKMADEAVSLGNGNLTSTYLNITRIVEIAIATGSQAIHPGYGFLSENYAFAKACEDNNLVFIGPSSVVLKLMSSKPEAKELAAGLGIPVAFSTKIDLSSSLPDEKLIQYPLLIKASFGGGGKGMELVQNHQELKGKLEKSSRMALNYFGNGEIFIEQYIQNARHVEVQIIGDNFNNIIHLYERECSVQRNHQKIIEEAPASFLSAEIRNEILSAAVKLGKAVNYSGAGTVEFLVDGSGTFFFMEMNPRIQVEHAVSEEITGIDIVEEQIRIASGLPLSVSQEEVKLTGHAIELRIYAENPAQDFKPSSDPILSVNMPSNPDLRIESDLNLIQSAKNQFDPLLIKLIARGKDRESTIGVLIEQVKHLNIIGPETNTKYLESILSNSGYQKDFLSVDFCKVNHNSLVHCYINKSDPAEINFLIAAAISNIYLIAQDKNTGDCWDHIGYWRSVPMMISIAIDSQIYPLSLNLKNNSNPEFVVKGVRIGFRIASRSKNNIDIIINKNTRRISAIFENQYFLRICCENIQHKISFPGLLGTYPEVISASENDSWLESGEIHSPMHGKILEISIIENQIIKKGDLMMIIEAMKSENRILSPRDAKVKKIAVNVGAQVTDRMPLIFLEDYMNE